MIFHCPGAALTRGRPCGRQSADESSLSCTPVWRSSSSALAQGWYGMSSTFRLAAMFAGWPPYVFSGLQIPDRSGLPSGNRGAGADRFAATGGTFVHCACRGAHTRTRTVTMEKAMMAFMDSPQMSMINILQARCTRGLHTVWVRSIESQAVLGDFP